MFIVSNGRTNDDDDGNADSDDATTANAAHDAADDVCW